MSSLSTEMSSFIKTSDAIFAEGKTRATALPDNTVQVFPGGATFSTIQAAIDSINNASPQLQYQVSVGPGTYKENVTMKDYVYVIGAGQTATTITAPPSQNFASGVVNSASGCGISQVTLNAIGGGWGACPAGVKINGSGKFHISGVTINSGGPGDVGNNTRGITNNTGSYTGNLVLGSSIINLQGGDSCTGVGVDLFGFYGVPNPPVLLIDVSSIQVTSNAQTFGVATSGGATVTLDDSKVIASTFALYNSDGQSLITANQCTIDGPVSSGVVVNN